jgi:signal peptide peptidase SppA
MNNIIAELQRENWAMEPARLNGLFMQLSKLGVDNPLFCEFMQKIEIVTPKNILTKNNRTAIINISGILMKTVPAVFKWFGIEAMEYGEIRKMIGEAINDNDIDSIILNIDSPGGSVSGVIETAEAIAEASKIKNITAHIQDLGASGAYLLASQTGFISAGPNAEVGAIGVFCVIADWSRMFENAGISVHVIKSGEHKGVGVTGAPITPEQIGAIQEVIDAMGSNFTAKVAAGRKITNQKAQELSSGKVWIASEALKLGLIDDVKNFVLPNSNWRPGISRRSDTNKEENKNGNSSQSKGDTMLDEKNEQKSEADNTGQTAVVADAKIEKVNISEFKEAFGDDPAFVLEQLEKGNTIEQAKAEYCEVLKGRLKNGAKKPAGGAPPVEHNEAADGDADFMELAKARAEEKKIKMSEAMKQIARELPEVYNQHIEKCKTKGGKKGKQ